jgi:hypothetical protein
VDSKGRITSASSINIPSATSTVTGLLSSTDYNRFITGVSAISATSNVNGGIVSGTNLILTPADGTNGGILTNGTQTIAGQKSFKSAVTNLSALSSASNSIDFSQSNLAYTSLSPGNFTLSGMKDGGTYTLAVQGTTAGFSNFSISGFTPAQVKSLGNYNTISGKQTLYSFVVMGTTVYYSMISEQ